MRPDLTVISRPKAEKSHILILGFILFVVSSHAEIPTREWRDLSDQDLSPEGKLALSSDKTLWKHAETEHFVTHFTDAKEAETVYVHAEVYYGWIKELFGVTTDTWKKKMHLFVFQDSRSWQAFLDRTHPSLQTDAFTTGWELFVKRGSYWLSPMKTTAHEITHVILFRFLDGPIPLSLNEGFAEFVSYRALAMQMGRSEYDLRTFQLVPEEKFIPLKDLLSARDYPAAPEDVEIFYRESELFVRYLILNHNSKDFYRFLRNVSAGQLVLKSLEGIYGMDFEILSERFEAFAIKKKTQSNSLVPPENIPSRRIPSSKEHGK